MTFSEKILEQRRPASIRNVVLPRRQKYHPSPVEWRDEILYFLLVDRFSDGAEDARPRLDRRNLRAARPKALDGADWRWDRWAESGGSRWQGGTLRGVTSKLGYLERLGVTALWLSPVFKQRGHLDTYHGYGIQDFFDVDPRFGDRKDLVDLVTAAHGRGLRVILDIIFNHSGANWVYPEGTPGGRWKPRYRAHPQRYDFGKWVGGDGREIDSVQGPDDGIWPSELRDGACYTRAGKGDLGRGDVADPNAEHKRTDFEDMRDFNLNTPGVLTDLALAYKYWIALTDCDGLRIDTLKHVTFEEARNFCGTIKEFAANLGKANFFLVGEVAGGDYNEEKYLAVLGRNIDAALDIGEMRLALNAVAKGLSAPSSYFGGFEAWRENMGSRRQQGRHHVSILDDHDHVMGTKIRFASEASSEHQVAAGVALQLFTLGIPCIYYGTEQGFAGPEESERRWLPEWKGSTDRYLREAMFGPEHPRKRGRDGLRKPPDGLDANLPGFGPFGTAGHHCFDENAPVFVRLASLNALRREYPVLRMGRQYLREISFLGRPFAAHGPGEIIAWSRILDDEEALCILNAHGTAARGADIVVDSSLNRPGSRMTVIGNSAQAGSAGRYGGPYPVGSTIGVHAAPDGTICLPIRDVMPSEIIVLSNRPIKEEGSIVV